MNNYFISYQGFLNGNLVVAAFSSITRPPIKTGDDIISIQNFLLEKNHRGQCDRILVVFWKRFEE